MQSKRKILFASMLCMLVIGSSACKKSSSSSDETTKEETVAYSSEIDKDEIMDISIDVDESDWQTMLDNATDKEYIKANVTINGTTIKNVGIKPKGNSSLTSVASSDSDRYSFKIKFDKYVDNQTYKGLDKLVLNNNYSDATSMKEYLSYDIMNFIGVDTPLYSYADIKVNDESWGFYLAIEVPDDSFLTRTNSGEGELYKPDNLDNIEDQATMGDKKEESTDSSTSTDSSESSTSSSKVSTDSSSSTDSNDNSTSSDSKIEPPTDGGDMGTPPDGDSGGGPGEGGGGGGMTADDAVSLKYIDDNISSYSSIFDNNVTKVTETDEQTVVSAIKGLNESTDIEDYVDVDAMLRYMAAHTVVVNLDSYSSNMGHNYLLYENDGKITMLPWDYNMAFGGFQSTDASSVVNFPIDTPVSGVSLEDRPMFAKLLENETYLKQYHAYIQEIVDEYFTDNKFEEKVDTLNDLIGTHVKNDPSAFFTYDEYTTAIAELKKLGTLRGESLQGQLDGTIPSTTDGQTEDSSALIDSSSVNLTSLGDSGGPGGDMEGGPGEGGGMQNEFDGIDQDTMKKAMEIIQSSTDGTLTDDQKSQLSELGLTDEQIEQLAKMSQNRPDNTSGGGPSGNQGGTGGPPDKSNSSSSSSSSDSSV